MAVRVFCIGDAVKRRDRDNLIGKSHCPPTSVALLNERCIFLMKVRGVGEHVSAQFGSCRSRVNPTAEPISHQCRQISAMVKVGMREDNRRNGAGFEWQVPVDLKSLTTMALEQATLK
jgi:hypothetical protein